MTEKNKNEQSEHKSWCRILDIGGPCDCKGTPTRADWSAYHNR